MSLPKSYGIGLGWPLGAGQGGALVIPVVVLKPVNLTAPAVNGTVQVGVLLSGNSGNWSNAPTSYAYKWTVSGSTVSTSPSYTPVTADATKSGNYTVTATNGAGSTAAAPVAFGPITAAAAVAPVNTAAPAVTGTAQVGVLLSGGIGAWSNSPTSYSYVWAVAGVTVATTTSYTPVTADATKSGTLIVTATNSGGSTASAPVAFGPITAAAAVAPVNTVPPAITGTAQVGVLLSGNSGNWSNAPTSYSYVWAVAGLTVATTTSYTPVTADASKSGTYAVTATNAAGSTAATPVAFGPIAAAAAGGTPAALAINSFSLAA